MVLRASASASVKRGDGGMAFPPNSEFPAIVSRPGLAALQQAVLEKQYVMLLLRESHSLLSISW